MPCRMRMRGTRRVPAASSGSHVGRASTGKRHRRALGVDHEDLRAGELRVDGDAVRERRAARAHRELLGQGDHARPLPHHVLDRLADLFFLEDEQFGIPGIRDAGPARRPGPCGR